MKDRPGGIDRPHVTRFEAIIFILLILIHLIPIWSVRYIPTTDGPSHLYNASIVLNYHADDAQIYRKYYTINHHFEPTWFGLLSLAGLMSVFPPLIAEKLFLSVYIILLPIAIFLIVRRINPESWFIGLLAFPFIYNWSMNVGFYSYVLSISLNFLIITYWMSRRRRSGWGSTLTLALLLLGLYLCHLVSLVMCFVGIGTLAGWLALLETRRRQREGIPLALACLKGFRMHLARPLAAMAPALILTAIFVHESSFSGSTIEEVSFVQRLVSMASLYLGMVSYQKWEVWLSTLLTLLFAALLIYGFMMRRQQGRLRSWDGWLLVALAYTVIFMLSPTNTAGGWYLTHRLNIYPFLALIPWFAIQIYQPPLRRVIMTVTMALSLGFVSIYTWQYHRIGRYLVEYTSITPQLPANATLLSIGFSTRCHTPSGAPLSQRIQPFLYCADHVALECHGLNLSDYQGHFGYFPTLYRPSLDPNLNIGNVLMVPPHIEKGGFASYGQRTGGSVDYVYVWRDKSEQVEVREAESIERELNAAYDLIYVTRPYGYGRLYQRRADAGLLKE